MIEVKTKIHDNFSVEFKQSFVSGYNTGEKKKDFVVNTWIFVPSSLDINSATYGKQQFWRDIKSNLRLITPEVELRDVTGTPLSYLKESIGRMENGISKTETDDFEYYMKMFCSISKSSMREGHAKVKKAASYEDASKAFIEDLKNCMVAYWGLEEDVTKLASQEIKTVYDFGDEYLGALAKYHSLKLLSHIEKTDPDSGVRDLCRSFVNQVDSDRKAKGFPVAEEGNQAENNNLVHRHSVLKKFFESGLFVSLDKKKDGVAFEQTLYAIAAGLAMIFATVVSFSVQRAYGSLSIPLFFALIFSYMIKDRIKELSRYWFVHKLSAHYFDNKSKIFVKGKVVGMMKEGLDFISSSRTPGVVMELRNRNSVLRKGDDFFDEHIILYRKLVSIYPDMLDEIGSYPIEGINDIFRIHLSRFTQKMDNPEQKIPILDENGNYSSTKGLKYYPVNIVQQLREGDRIEYRRVRVIMSRNGIYSIEEIKA